MWMRLLLLLLMLICEGTIHLLAAEQFMCLDGICNSRGIPQTRIVVGMERVLDCVEFNTDPVERWTIERRYRGGGVDVANITSSASFSLQNGDLRLINVSRYAEGIYNCSQRTTPVECVFVQAPAEFAVCHDKMENECTNGEPIEVEVGKNVTLDTRVVHSLDLSGPCNFNQTIQSSRLLTRDSSTIYFCSNLSPCTTTDKATVIKESGPNNNQFYFRLQFQPNESGLYTYEVDAGSGVERTKSIKRFNITVLNRTTTVEMTTVTSSTSISTDARNSSPGKNIPPNSGVIAGSIVGALLVATIIIIIIISSILWCRRKHFTSLSIMKYKTRNKNRNEYIPDGMVEGSKVDESLSVGGYHRHINGRPHSIIDHLPEDLSSLRESKQVFNI